MSTKINPIIIYKEGKFFYQESPEKVIECAEQEWVMIKLISSFNIAPEIGAEENEIYQFEGSWEVEIKGQYRSHDGKVDWKDTDFPRWQVEDSTWEFRKVCLFTQAKERPYGYNPASGPHTAEELGMAPDSSSKYNKWSVQFEEELKHINKNDLEDWLKMDNEIAKPMKDETQEELWKEVYKICTGREFRIFRNLENTFHITRN